MKELLISILFAIFILLTISVIGQDPDSSIVIFHSDRSIEIIKPFYPTFEKREKREMNSITLPTDSMPLKEKYDVLKDGEIKVYNRFYQLTQYFQYRDSALILYEYYDTGIKQSQQLYLQGDSVFSLSLYYADGTPQHQEYISPDSLQRAKWFKNGQIQFYCTLTGVKKDIQQEDCYYWNEQGFFEKGERHLLETKNENMGPESIQVYQLDKNGNIKN